MEEFAFYLLKSSGLLIAFWGIYVLFLQKETLFRENRWFLITGILVSLGLPFFKLTKTVAILPTAFDSAVSGYSYAVNTGAMVNESFNWSTWLLVIYLLGCTYFFLKFLSQLHSIRKLSEEGSKWHEGDLTHVRTKRKIAPFSFFKSLFYNPKQFKEKELQVILRHEKVHAQEWHSVDVIISEFLKIVLWFNPMTWAYKNTIKQNLEFLADAKAISGFNKKSYQFLMVNQATGSQLEITNSFYNSLIKKRIVMLNKKPSKSSNALKSLLVLPLLALFMVGFNTEKVYENTYVQEVLQGDTAKTIELIINKDTSDEELSKMKKELAEDGIDLSYTTVRNEDREIIDISVHVSGKSKNGSTFKNSHASSDDNGISSLVIFIDAENNLVSIGTKGTYKSKVSKIGSGKNKVWVSSGDSEHKEVVIENENGVRKIYIDGVEVDKEDLHEHGVNVFVDEDGSHEDVKVHVISDDNHEKSKHVKVKRHKSKNGESVMIIKDADHDSDIEVMSDDGFFFIDTDGEGEPLYIVDGKEVSQKVVKKLSPKEIATIDVSKGKAAKKKYGKKAKNGVVEIVTKKKN